MQSSSDIEVQIRMAKEDDASSVVAWFTTHADAVLWGGPKVPENFDAPWFAHEIGATADVYRVAYRRDEQIAGVYGVRSFAPEQRLHILRVAIAPLYRGQGLGRRLIADTLSIAQTQGASTASLNVYGSNVRAFKIYENLGFRAVKEQDAPEDSSGTSIYMERPVRPPANEGLL